MCELTVHGKIRRFKEFWCWRCGVRLFLPRSITTAGIIKRKFIISIHAINTIWQWFNGRLKIELSVPESEEIIVTRKSAKDFKDWLSR